MKRFVCPADSRRSCADIKIAANPADTAVYKPSPIVVDETNFPKTFTCLLPYDGYYATLLKYSVPDISLFPDVYKYNGAGVICVGDLDINPKSNCMVVS